MRTMIVSKEPPVSEGDLLAKVSSLWCLATETNNTPDGAQRIPVSIFTHFTTRDSAQWVVPSSASEGQQKLHDMFQRWIDDLNSEVDIPHSSPVRAVVPHDDSRKSLLQVQIERSKKRYNNG